MTSDTGTTRAWIVTHPDQKIEEVPLHIAEDDVIRWPDNTMPEKRPGAAVEFFAAGDFYHRFVLQPEKIAVFVHASQDPDALAEGIAGEIRSRASR